MHLDREIVKPLLAWYEQNARILPWREEPTAYRVWISEIMLQQTRVEAVKPYYHRFMNVLPDVEALAFVEDEKLMKLWEGLGYYNRARNLKIAAGQILKDYDGNLPADYEQLLSLKGIGEYTAGAIASIAFKIPVPAVDGNVLRVITRIMADESDILKASTKKMVTKALLEIIPEEQPGDFNQALMELGAMVCVPNGAPHCEKCPWNELCLSNKRDLTYKIPVKTPKKQRKIEEKTVFLLEYQGKIAIHKRPSSGLLAGLWEFPNEDSMISLAQMEEKLSSWQVQQYKVDVTKKAKHIFSHIEWHMAGFYVECQQKPQMDHLVWINREELEHKYAIPAAFEAFKGIL
ncbi:MAG: A/G-specific adenine glycosylase [Lachnospiraceae bacterium]|nr:A/G-specific adenine glycosylase [Lachnospiraceae bacterium]